MPTFLRFSDLRKLEFSRLGSGAGRARLLIGWCQSQSGVPGEIVSLGYFAAKREKRERFRLGEYLELELLLHLLHSPGYF